MGQQAGWQLPGPVKSGGGGGAKVIIGVVVGLVVLVVVGVVGLMFLTKDSVDNLEVGDCFDDPEDLSSGEISDAPTKECSESHDNEVYDILELPDAAFPGETAVQEQARTACLEGFTDYTGQDYQTSPLDIGAIYPIEERWDSGDREVICFLYNLDLSPLVGSQKA